MAEWGFLIPGLVLFGYVFGWAAIDRTGVRRVPARAVVVAAVATVLSIWLVPVVGVLLCGVTLSLQVARRALGIGSELDIVVDRLALQRDLLEPDEARGRVHGFAVSARIEGQQRVHWRDLVADTSWIGMASFAVALLQGFLWSIDVHARTTISQTAASMMGTMKPWLLAMMAVGLSRIARRGEQGLVADLELPGLPDLDLCGTPSGLEVGGDPAVVLAVMTPEAEEVALKLVGHGRVVGGVLELKSPGGEQLARRLEQAAPMLSAFAIESVPKALADRVHGEGDMALRRAALEHLHGFAGEELEGVLAELLGADLDAPLALTARLADDSVQSLAAVLVLERLGTGVHVGALMEAHDELQPAAQRAIRVIRARSSPEQAGRIALALGPEAGGLTEAAHRAGAIQAARRDPAGRG